MHYGAYLLNFFHISVPQNAHIYPLQQTRKKCMHSVCLSTCLSVYPLTFVNILQFCWNYYRLLKSNIAWTVLKSSEGRYIGSYGWSTERQKFSYTLRSKGVFFKAYFNIYITWNIMKKCIVLKRIKARLNYSVAQKIFDTL